MKLAMIGLGRMGGNMARRMVRAGIEVVGFNRSFEVAEKLAAEESNASAAATLEEAVDALASPRVVWVMLPAGDPTEQTLERLTELLSPGDVVVDGGNANYHDTQRRGAMFADKGIGFADAGTSGGVWGLDNGYCMMVGASEESFAVIEPAIRALAPGDDRGWAHVGPVGAGHFTKMIHNGVEYGMMQAMAEGFALLEGKQEFDLDLAEISEIWRHGSVVRSWLLDLTADALKQDQTLEGVAPYVADSGEGRWTAVEAIDQGVATPVMSLALSMRFASQDERGYTNRLLSMMRNAFGGHAVKKS